MNTSHFNVGASNRTLCAPHSVQLPSGSQSAFCVVDNPATLPLHVDAYVRRRRFALRERRDRSNARTQRGGGG